MLKSKLLLTLSLISLGFFAIAMITYQPEHASANASRADKHGFDRSNMDTSVAACANFFQYANGGWIARNEIPAAYPRWGNFNDLAERNRDKLHEILDAAAKNTKAPKGSNEQKLGDYYGSCMEEEAIEAAGTKPLGVYFERIGKIKDPRELTSEIARLHLIGV